MLTKEKELLIQKVIQEDAAIAAEMEAADSIAAICSVFAARGVVLTEDEAADLLAQAVVPEMNGELGEDDLDAVAGGITWKQAKSAFMVGARIGMGARMLYDKYKYGNAQRTYSYSQLASGKFW